MGQAVPIDTPEGAFELVLTVPGQHNISNALAAMAAAHTLGVPIARAVEALATAQQRGPAASDPSPHSHGGDH